MTVPAAPDGIHRQQAEYLKRHTVTSPAINMVTAAMLVVVLWPNAPQLPLVAWLAAMLGLNLVRIAALWRDPDDSTFLRWRLIYLAGALAAGALWGATVLLMPAALEYKAIILLVVAGMVAGALATLGIVGQTFLYYIALATGPLTLKMLSYGDYLHATIGLFVMIFAIGISYAGHEVQRIFQETLQAKAQMQDLANRDELTGLANRRRFNEFLEEEWQRSLRAGYPVSLLLVDVDDFKKYNDRYGHLQGDRCLRQMAEVLSAALPRRTDLLARYGGEEFVALLSMTAESGAQSVAQRLRRAVESLALMHELSSTGRHVTISLGGASAVARRDTSPNVLLSTADEALYRAKERGKNCLDWGRIAGAGDASPGAPNIR
jgi:diguanylate cyclase (GGDEF)-like protein